jgi:hypothetical protein
VPAPQSAAFALLALCVPFVLLLGDQLAGRVSVARGSRIVLAPALGLSAWLLVVHGTGRLVGSFTVSLVAGSLLVALVGAGVRVRWPVAMPADDGEEPVAWPWLVVVALFSTALVAAMAINWAFHDELYLTGHMSMAAQIQNGIYPPRHLTFPQLELAYHYGFAVVVAAFSTVTRVSIPTAIDAVTLGCFAYTSCLLWLLGHRAFGPRAAPFTAIVGLFGAGIPFFAPPAGAPFAHRVLGIARVDVEGLNAPIVSFFFQHPWTLGLPLTCALLLLLTDKDRRDSSRYVAIALLLIALYLCQVVLFLTMSGMLLVAETFIEGRADRRRLASVLIVLLVAAVAAVSLGGFFVGNPDRQGAGLVLRSGVGLAWYAQVFGLLLPLGGYGIWRAGPLRIPLAILAAGSLVVFNFTVYQHSHDIVKFATVAAFALAIGTGIGIADLHQRWSSAARFRKLATPMAAGVTALTCAAGFGFALVFAVEIPGIPRHLFHEAPVVLESDDADAIAFLRTRIAEGEMVFRDAEHASGYAQWGGLPVPWIDNMVARMGFSDARIQQRMALLQQPPMKASELAADGMRWLVLDADDVPFTWLANRWINSGEARLVATFGGLQVVEIPR